MGFLIAFFVHFHSIVCTSHLFTSPTALSQVSCLHLRFSNQCSVYLKFILPKFKQLVFIIILRDDDDDDDLKSAKIFLSLSCK